MTHGISLVRLPSPLKKECTKCTFALRLVCYKRKNYHQSHQRKYKEAANIDHSSKVSVNDLLHYERTISVFPICCYIAGAPKYGLRANSSPRSHFTRPAKIFC